MDPGFRKADLNTLPKVDFFMVQQFLSTNDKFRDSNKQGKIERSKNPDYLQSAIGKVQYKIEGDIVTVKAKVVPEHRVTQRKYSVVALINTLDEEVIDVYCESEADGCKAAAGGCKHAVAFLFYLYEKYSQPSPTESTCLWKMPQLAKVDENIGKFNLSCYKASGIVANNPVAVTTTGSGTFLQTLLNKCPLDTVTTCLKYHQPVPKTSSYSVHCLLHDFKKRTDACQNVRLFDDFCKTIMKRTVCTDVEVCTRGQNNSLWNILKFGRITASKIYDLSRCKTTEGTLVQAVLGQHSVTTEAMQRGLLLEEKVVEILKKRYRNVRRCGLYLDPDYPMFGASPDAINETSVFEIKCPSKEENYKYYVDSDGQLKNRVYSQIQLQMLMTQREDGILVLVEPGFERARKPEDYVEFYPVEQDIDFTTDIMRSSYRFWATNIFDKLYKKFK